MSRYYSSAKGLLHCGRNSRRSSGPTVSCRYSPITGTPAKELRSSCTLRREVPYTLPLGSLPQIHRLVAGLSVDGR